MRTAEEILKEHLQSLDWQTEPNKVTTTAMYLRSIDAINAARREALEEAAEKAKVKYTSCGDPMTCGCHGTCEHPYASVNKQSILNLVKELK